MIDKSNIDADTLVNGGALQLALNSLRRGTQSQKEIADELEKTAARTEAIRADEREKLLRELVGESGEVVKDLMTLARSWFLSNTTEESLAAGNALHAAIAARVVPLMAEIERLKATLAQEARARENVSAMRSEMQSRVEQLEKDAKRYRWLRDKVVMGYPSSEGSDRKDAYLVVTGYGYKSKNQIVDDAVDAAYAQEGGVV